MLRANRVAATSENVAGVLPADLRFHALRHTYASLCAAAGISARQVAKFMGHANTTTTEHIYTHLFETANFSTEMTALDALGQTAFADNVIPLHG